MEKNKNYMQLYIYFYFLRNDKNNILKIHKEYLKKENEICSILQQNVHIFL